MSQTNSIEFTDTEILLNEPMKSHSSFGVGGRADFFVKVRSLYGLNEVITKCQACKFPYKVIGNGTNILVSDYGYHGCIISTEKLNDVFFKLDQVKAMCGAQLSKLIAFASDNSFGGIQALSGIPATVGGAIVMNAGAFGCNISDYLTSVETIKDGKIIRYDKDQCRFGYRTSSFLNKNEPVVSATFKLKKGEGREFVAESKRVLGLRKKLHPSGRTCGSVFKNPDVVSAGQLIESAGLKGTSLGGATVSDKHANFIVNTGGATADDIYRLIGLIKDKVKTLFGVNLVEELEYIGEF